MNKKILLSIIFCLAAWVAKAQFTEYYGQENTTCHLIVGDTVWAGTSSENGIVKMLTNGQVLQRWTTKDFPFPDYALDMCLDTSGNLLVVYQLGGFAKFDGATWTMEETWNTPLENIAVDYRGSRWLNFPTQTWYWEWGEWKSIDHQNRNLTRLKTDPYGRVFFADQTDKRVSRWDNNVWTHTDPAQTNNAEPRDFTWDTAGNMYVLTFDQSANKNTIWKYAAGTFQNPTYILEQTLPVHQHFERILVDSEENIWISGGAFTPIQKWDGANWTIYDRENSLRFASGSILQMSQANDGGLWFSGDIARLTRFQDDKWKVFQWGFGGNSSDGEVDAQGRIWYAGANGIGNYDPQTGGFNIEIPYKDSASYDLAFHTMEIASDGTIWCGSSTGVFRFDGQNWTKYDASNTGGAVPYGYVYKIREDAEQNLWFVTTDTLTWQYHLVKYAITTDTWTDLTDWSINNFNASVPYLATSSDSSVWFSHYLGVARLKNGEVTNWESPLGGLNYGGPIEIARDGRVWVNFFAYGFGIFDGNNWTEMTSANSELLNSEGIVDFDFATDNSLWVSTTDGLNTFRALQRYTGYAWETYTDQNSNLGISPINLIITGDDGSVWLHDQDEFYSFTSRARWLRGKVLRDDNANCLPDTSELPLNQWIVQASEVNTGQSFFGKTNQNGLYEINLDSASYSIFLYPPSQLWDNCGGSTVADLTTNLFANADFSGEVVENCPLLDLDLSVPLLRRCFPNTYQVRYCNIGTAVAENAYVVFDLPAELILQNVSLPYSQPTVNQLLVPVGNVESGDCGGFNFTVLVDCATTDLGEILCVNAHIYPDTFCVQEPGWSGADLSARAQCDGDSVIFKVKNKGFGDMSQTLEYIVIEDEVIMRIAPLLLPAGDSMLVHFPVNSAFQRIQLPQETGHPYQGIVSAAVEGCNGQTSSENFLIQYAFDNASPFEVVVCEEAIGSFDPNDKAASPLGYGAEHYVYPKTVFDYKIRFQNTGTDTAFNIVVRDTLDKWLDISTLQVGAVSHPYKWEILGSNILTFTFENILLPDSNINEPASHGFLHFSIKPVDTIPLGTLVPNTAGIYFDFNEAVLTNTVFHTVDTGFLEVDLPPVAVGDNLLKIKALQVSPNPSAGQFLAVLGLPNSVGSANQKLKYELNFADGRTAETGFFDGNNCVFPKNALASGVYFFKVFDVRGGVVAAEKVVVK